ncbi:YwaF family protein [Ichthyenterobacterium magnum]|uniref:Putative integral membrane protein (TIGR02206 family) n=1 Tax=Ichthyenterobacterium magnum TaxID=1230530 RepID=A0A420DFC4_9FLAO|nr:TIGR02206 family membrane protein [Ichthyenterobacterium magnum]RKE90896.1 putative integral membrane protein (TIGR02206 family) [Ichthyenterobacterium magnum]
MIAISRFFLLQRVSIGSLEHLTPIIVAALFSIWFIRRAKKLQSLDQQQKNLHWFAIGVSLTVVCFHLYQIFNTNYNVKTDLPLYLCSLLALLIPLFTYYRKYWMFEVLVFLIISGTLQGVITPDIPEGFPSFDYFRYWVVHLGLLIIIFYAIFVFKMKPKFKSVFKSFFVLQFYVLIIIATNYMLDANYFYLNKKPESASLLDYFGDWPYYIIVVQIIVIPLFMLIYLPFYIFKKQSKLH